MNAWVNIKTKRCMCIWLEHAKCMNEITKNVPTTPWVKRHTKKEKVILCSNRFRLYNFQKSNKYKQPDITSPLKQMYAFLLLLKSISQWKNWFSTRVFAKINWEYANGVSKNNTVRIEKVYSIINNHSIWYKILNTGGVLETFIHQTK